MKRIGQGNGWMSQKTIRRRQSKICTAVIVISLLLLAAIVLVKSISLYEQKTELLAQEEEITAQIEEAKEEYAELEEQEAYMKTKKYVEEVARNQLGLVYPDEIVIRPSE